MLPLPASVPQLIKQLDEKFPDACPKLSDTDREVWFKAGQRSVVEHLTARQKMQEEDAKLLQFPA